MCACASKVAHTQFLLPRRAGAVWSYAKSKCASKETPDALRVRLDVDLSHAGQSKLSITRSVDGAQHWCTLCLHACCPQRGSAAIHDKKRTSACQKMVLIQLGYFFDVIGLRPYTAVRACDRTACVKCKLVWEITRRVHAAIWN
jgi:hypothetical protein